MNWLKSLFTTASKPKKQRVLIHFDDGDCER